MDNDFRVITSLFYVTRSCNIDCSYCAIWDNHFPDELVYEDKLRAIDILMQGIKSDFLILFGGEPLMLGDKLVDLVRWLYKRNYKYAITSNSILLNRPKAIALAEAGLQNWSVSLDTLMPGKNPIAAKSHKGFSDLLMLKELGVPDLHATVTITKQNMTEILPIIDLCNRHGVWVELTALHWHKGKGYYFASPKDKMSQMLLQDEDYDYLARIFEQVKQRKQQGYFIHNDLEYFDAFLQHAPWLDWYCHGLSTMVVDADGKIKTCLHFNDIEGTNILDLENPLLRSLFFNEHNNRKFGCAGCFWDCRFQSQQWANTDPDKGAAVFGHF